MVINLHMGWLKLAANLTFRSIIYGLVNITGPDFNGWVDEWLSTIIYG